MMSTPSQEEMHKLDRLVQSRCSIPRWVDSFLEKSFFEKCSSHSQLKNDHNRYCITCDAALCRYCIAGGDHKGHNVLTIYRHVYQNVVPLSEMEMHLDCKKIQPYKCNKKWVVSLNPLPHNGSGSLNERNGACAVCKRKLTDPECFRFCSITCKVQVISGTRALRASAQSGVGTSRQRDAADENPSKRKRSRKGIPIRAPFR